MILLFNYLTAPAHDRPAMCSFHRMRQAPTREQFAELHRLLGTSEPMEFEIVDVVDE